MDENRDYKIKKDYNYIDDYEALEYKTLISVKGYAKLLIVAAAIVAVNIPLFLYSLFHFFVQWSVWPLVTVLVLYLIVIMSVSAYDSYQKIIRIQEEYIGGLDTIRRKLKFEAMKVDVPYELYIKYDKIPELIKIALKTEEKESVELHFDEPFDMYDDGDIDSDIKIKFEYGKYYRDIENNLLDEVRPIFKDSLICIAIYIVGAVLLETFMNHDPDDKVALYFSIMGNIISLIFLIRAVKDLFDIKRLADDYKESLKSLKQRLALRGYFMDIPEEDMHKYESIIKLMINSVKKR